MLCLLIKVYFFLSCVNAANAKIPENASWITNERKLWHYLLHGEDPYEKSVRPVRTEKEALDVGFEISLLQIDSLYEEAQVLHLIAWMRMSWKDVQLTWNPAEFGGLSEIRLSKEMIWTPDIVLYNSHPSANNVEDSSYQVVVTSDGQVLWVPPVHLATPCEVDFTHFPYDTQTCKLKFGSWTYSGKQVNLKHYDDDKLDVNYYSDHHQFQLVEHKAELSGQTYACCPGDIYPYITYTLTLKRRTTFATSIYVSPAVAMCLILPAIFLLPPESKQKINFGVGLLVTNALVLIILIDMLPLGHPTVPDIALYHTANMILVCICMAISALIINIWSKGERSSKMPNFLKSVVLGICGRVLCVPRDNFMPVASNVPIQMRQNFEVLSNEGQQSPAKEGDQEQILQSYSVASQAAEWRQLAIIMDRLCFFVVLIIEIIITLAMATK